MRFFVIFLFTLEFQNDAGMRHEYLIIKIY
jgi:hypothetical protein